MTRILLVRHGQSTWNASGRWQGWADPPLTDLGRQQAWSAAAAVGTVDAIVASDLDRAIATAVVISEVIGVGPVVVEPGLRERDVGEWTGCTRAEIAERWPHAFTTFLTGAAGGSSAQPITPPGGESVDDLVVRATAAVHRIADLVGPGGEAVAVTHGGVIRSLERHLGQEPAPVPNLGALWVEVEPDHRLRAAGRVLLMDPHDAAVTVPRQL